MSVSDKGIGVVYLSPRTSRTPQNESEFASLMPILIGGGGLRFLRVASFTGKEEAS
jgi:hypothetical protein